MFEKLKKYPYSSLFQIKAWLLVFFTTIILYSLIDKSFTLWIHQVRASHEMLHILLLFSQFIALIFDSKFLMFMLLVLLMGSRLIKYQGWFYQLAIIISLFFIMDNIVASVIKTLMGRMRPEFLIEQGRYGFYFFKHSEKYLSFPSGHAINLMVVASILMIVFPQKKAMIFVLACLGCLSRVWYLKHYLSDVFFAGALVFTLFPIQVYLLEKCSKYPRFAFLTSALNILKPNIQSKEKK